MQEFRPLADVYIKGRPDYPEAFLEQIVDEARQRNLLGEVWDGAAGNYQVANRIADSFKVIYANDISPEQLSKAHPKKNVIPFIGSCEDVPDLSNNSIDVVTCGQAFHWLNREAFLDKAHRVLHPGGMVAIFGYGFPQTDDKDVQTVIDSYYRILQPYRDQKLKLLDDEYRDLDLSKLFAEISMKPAYDRFHWKFDNFMNYFASSEMVTRATEDKGYNPLEIDIKPHLSRVVPEDRMVEVQFKFFGKMGVKP